MKKILSFIVIAVLCLGIFTSCAQIQGLLDKIPGMGGGEVEEPHVHTEVIDVEVAPTCTEPGKTAGMHCSECNEVIIAQETIPATGHTEVEDAAVDATCTEAGKTAGKHCSTCHEVLVAQETVPTKSHTFEEGVCTVCGAEDPDFVLATWTVAGPEGLTGANWDPTNTANDLVLCEDGLYTKTYEDIAAGHYWFKVVKNHAWDVAYPATDYHLLISEKCDVVITFNPENNKVSATLIVGDETIKTDGAYYMVTGDDELCGDTDTTNGDWGWELENYDNLMSLNADGKYEKIYTNLAVGTYEFKVVKNMSWDHQWSDNNNNFKIVIEKNLSSAKIILDLEANSVSVEIIPGPDYRFKASDLAAIVEGDVSKGDTLKVGTDEYFTLIFGDKGKTQDDSVEFSDGYAFGTHRLSFNGKTKAESKTVTRSIMFTTDGPAVITIWWKCGADGRTIEIYTFDGNKTITPIHTSSNETEKSGLYVTTFKIEAAGTYYLGHTSGTSYFYQVDVTKVSCEHTYTGAVLEGADGFYQECDKGCGETKAVNAPLADGYKATINNEYSSSRENELILALGKYGSWGIDTNGKFKDEEGAPEIGAIGGLDAAGKYVYYTFTLDKAGVVDIIWNIAGSNWDGSGNAGLADMAQHMTLTIDGKPVDISGLALPKGEGDVPQWWNLHNLVIEGVALEAGTHTIKCDVVAAGGLNVGPMTIKSNKAVDTKRAEITGVDYIVRDSKIYYAITANIHGYTAEDIKFYDGDNTFPITTEAGENGATVILVDVTDLAIGTKVSPHISFGGKMYVNNANANGDVRGDGIVFEEKAVKHGDKYFQIFKEWEMPCIVVVTAVAKANGADIFVEGDKVYYTLTFQVIGYDPANFEFFDGNTVFAQTYEQNGTTVVFKFDVTNFSGTLWPHLRINGATWDGGPGDVKPPFAEKSVELGGKTYSLKNQWDLATVVVS